ncbi:MAG: methylated-DNA--[protein]-cysteine S-methyltransferase [Balneolaceae bacterium]|nr:methylated-DNA--[protein]-cysteine S-methyltransferase [Balneolaceae bacterium]
MNSDNPVVTMATNQLREYFEGRRTVFDLPLNPSGSEFQVRVWKSLQSVGFGETVTYGQLAERLGDPDTVRAVGRANGQNPIPVVIPCHRVIGSNGMLVGYSGGIERKEWLLKHEGALLL